jgi:hypothetical protein
MQTSKEGLKMVTSIKGEGLLEWVLRKIVAEKVAAEVPEQTRILIKLASRIK